MSFRPKLSNLEATAICCSTSYKDKIPTEELKAVLTGEKALSNQWLAHFATLFNEVPHAFIAGTMKELNISFDDINKIYLSLPDVLRGKTFERSNYA